jgi:hypothetical protein
MIRFWVAHASSVLASASSRSRTSLSARLIRAGNDELVICFGGYGSKDCCLGLGMTMPSGSSSHVLVPIMLSEAKH